MLTRTRKEEIVADLKRCFQGDDAIFVLEPKPMPVSVFTGLRVRVREVGGSVRMIKNTIALRAIDKTNYSVLSSAFSGPSVMLVGSDSLALSKALRLFEKENEGALVYKGGVIDGQAVDSQVVRALAELPSIDELRAQLVGVLASSSARLVRTISALPQAFVNVLSNKVEKGE